MGSSGSLARAKDHNSTLMPPGSDSSRAHPGPAGKEAPADTRPLLQDPEREIEQRTDLKTRKFDLGFAERVACAITPTGLPRKEVIQPHLPVRLPCYDFVPIAGPTLGGCVHKGSLTDFRRLQLS